MININNYILEKLHISKETNSELSEGDDAIMFTIEDGDYMMSIRKIHIDTIIDNQIKYYKYKWNKPKELYTTSHEFIMHHGYKVPTNEDDNIRFIFTLDKGLEFIDAILETVDKMPAENYHDMDNFNLKKWIDYDKNDFKGRYIQDAECNIIKHIKYYCNHD